MTTREERERLLQGQDPMANAIVGYLATKGWQVDRILKNVVMKRYAPHTASIRVEFDSEYQQYWLWGEYVSQGNNVIAGCFCCVKTTTTQKDLATALDNYLESAERGINGSFAVRFLGDGAKAPPPPVNQGDSGATADTAGANLVQSPASYPMTDEMLLLQIPNQAEIVNAGLPRERLIDLARALEAFWDCYRHQFPEVTTGDSHMVDEPSNALAVWVAQELDIQISRQGLVLPRGPYRIDGCSPERFESAMGACVHAVMDALRPTIPSISLPGPEVAGFLNAVVGEVLFHNFPEEVEPADEWVGEDDDDEEEGSAGDGAAAHSTGGPTLH